MGKNRRKPNQQSGDVASDMSTMSLNDKPMMDGVPPPGAQAGASRGRGRGRGRGRNQVEQQNGDFPPLGGAAAAKEEFPALGGGRPGGPTPGGPPPGLGGPGPTPGGPHPGLGGPPPGSQREDKKPEPSFQPPSVTPAPVKSQHQPQGKVRMITQAEITEQEYQALDLVPPKRPGYGKRYARQIQLNTNHFTVALRSKGGQIQHYDVDIRQADPPPRRGPTDNKIPKGFARRLIDLVEAENKSIFHDDLRVVYDGVANLYTPVPLQLDPPDSLKKTFTVSRISDRGNKDTFYITLTWAATIQMAQIERYMRGDIKDIPQNAVNAIDNVFRQNAISRADMVSVGRSFYIQPSDPNKAYLGEGREIWMGYFQSARISNQETLTLNVDITATTFYPEQNCVKFAMEFLKLRDNDTRPLKETNILKLRREMSGLKCEMKYASIKKVKKITSISLRSAANQTFKIEQAGNKQMSVAKYFQEKYKIPLRFPHMPCIQFGRRDGQTFIPMELCTIIGGQRGQRKMTSDQTSNMIRRTAMPPADRQRQIIQRVRESNFGSDPFTRAFGIEVNPTMITLGGRILQPPVMVYEGNKTINPRAGAWDPKFLRFFKSTAEPVSNWGMVCFCDRTDGSKLQNFLDQLQSQAAKTGLQFTKPAYTGMERLAECRAFLAKAAANGLKFLICVLPGNSTDIYGQIKAYANVEFGIMTQCLKSQTVGKCNPMLLGNVLQKINAKLGGVNHVPHDDFVMKGVMNKPTIIFGADVTHPAPGDSFRPSIAAVVASMDRNACKYESRSEVQAHRKEIIVDLASMVKELLMAFFRNTNKKPERIMFYRDGVSEGQFTTVLNEELRAIQKACTQISPEYKPGITFLVVQKRHHTRFFPVNSNDGEGKHRNVPAGTCVDHTVTHATEHDFYLCSHAGIQGTSKPAHYHVLWDDNNLSADDLQALSFYLCHCYSNCSRSVSIPAPAYYAHKVAALARFHLEPVFENGSEYSGSSSSSSGEPTDEMRKAIMLAENLPKMFFL